VTYKVLFSHDKCGKRGAKMRKGKEVYRHPEGRFIVLELTGKSGKFREAFWPEEIERVG